MRLMKIACFLIINKMNVKPATMVVFQMVQNVYDSLSNQIFLLFKIILSIIWVQSLRLSSLSFFLGLFAALLKLFLSLLYFTFSCFYTFELSPVKYFLNIYDRYSWLFWLNSVKYYWIWPTKNWPYIVWT